MGSKDRSCIGRYSQYSSRLLPLQRYLRSKYRLTGFSFSGALLLAHLLEPKLSSLLVVALICHPFPLVLLHRVRKKQPSIHNFIPHIFCFWRTNSSLHNLSHEGGTPINISTVFVTSPICITRYVVRDKIAHNTRNFNYIKTSFNSPPSTINVLLNTVLNLRYTHLFLWTKPGQS